MEFNQLPRDVFEVVAKHIDSLEDIFSLKISCSTALKMDYSIFSNCFLIICRIGIYEVVERLIGSADVHADDDCALRLASCNGHYNTTKLLLEHKADVHADDDYALRCASHNGHYSIVELLLEHKANVYALNDYAIRLSSHNGHYKVVELLKSYM